MKKFISTIVLCLFAVMQSSASHLKFMDVEITGSVNEFKEKLISNGLKFESEMESAYKMTGKFANIDGCEIYLCFSPETETIHQVVVYFPEICRWRDLKKEYFKIKKYYDAKYEIVDEFAYFIWPYEEGHGNEMDIIWRGDSHYETYYQNDFGCISLVIAQHGQVCVSYEDDASTERAEDEIQSKIYSQI